MESLATTETSSSLSTQGPVAKGHRLLSDGIMDNSLLFSTLRSRVFAFHFYHGRTERHGSRFSIPFA